MNDIFHHFHQEVNKHKHDEYELNVGSSLHLRYNYCSK